MRLLTLSILLIFFFASCQKEGSDNSSPLSGKLQQLSEKDSSSNSLVDSINYSTIITYSYNAISQRLIISHQNACFSCTCDSIHCYVTSSGNSIIVEEREFNGNLLVPCLYDLEVEVDGVSPDVTCSMLLSHTLANMHPFGSTSI